MKDLIPKIARGAGIFTGAFFLVGAVIEPLTIQMTLITVGTGLLLVIPWTRLRNQMIWWPAYITLSTLLLFLIMGQVRQIVSNDTKRILGLIWIVIELAQPIVIWKMKRTPNINALRQKA